MKDKDATWVDFIYKSEKDESTLQNAYSWEISAMQTTFVDTVESCHSVPFIIASNAV
ncbi:hypothetical protein WN55_04297 [Dufourea novaeangliae]|uniref:Uncharacterized protein n=1 Tax=Dufourea novaeangliae TaxID=178035 RepID=A0A154PLM5_DUFNO|nr:hypothetical protein WN55_04297 [Dufourea novaeangliae]